MNQHLALITEAVRITTAGLGQIFNFTCSDRISIEMDTTATTVSGLDFQGCLHARTVDAGDDAVGDLFRGIGRSK